MSKATTISKSQNAIDVALQHGGNLEGLFDVAALNGLTITDSVPPGIGIVPDTQNQAAKFLASKNIKVATGSDHDNGTGIGYMIIEEDFIVS